MKAPDFDTATPLAALAEQALEISTRLHPAISAFDEAAARYAITGTPGVAFFLRDETDTIRHISSSPDPSVLPLVEDLRCRHAAAVGLDADGDNSHLPALILLGIYLADDATRERLGLDTLMRKPTEICALDEEHAKHDPPLEPHDGALRAWVPLTAEHEPDAGEHAAVLEFRFRMMRKPRYAPW